MSQQPRRGAFAALRQFVRPGVQVERCELCSRLLAADHPHLLELPQRKLCCVCDACGVLFSDPAGVRYRRIPRDIRRLGDFRLPTEVWESLNLPIDLVFFVLQEGAGDRVETRALYPGPAGATEALLPLDSWPALVEANPELETLQPEVEALLVHRGQAEFYLVPIDQCFRLVGLIRRRWRGLSGGVEVWQEVAEFFRRLRGCEKMCRRA